jgi:hypothetical protein
MGKGDGDEASDVDLSDALWPGPGEQGMLLATFGLATAHKVDTDLTEENVRS